MKRSDPAPQSLINPFEKMILTLGILATLASLYSYLKTDQTIHPSILTQTHSNPLSEGRRLASISQIPLKTLEFQCFTPQDVIVHSKKVRIIGHICNAFGSLGNPQQLISSKINNTTHPFEATVFAVTDSAEFSTDYIPLTLGDNILHFEFSFSDQPTFTTDWKIHYSPEISQGISPFLQKNQSVQNLSP